MQKMELGQSGIMVSDWCLGTMTYGNQTPESDAHAQIDMALDAGITFLDCAEIYPVNPIRAETVGRSEEILGRWFAKMGRRSEVVLATKIAGPNGVVRDGSGISSESVRIAVDGSLRRLQTDVIDLYQLHVPQRGTYSFRQNWGYDPSRQDRATNIAHMDDVLGALADLVAEGKIRAFGLSNETTWGTTRWIDRSEVTGGPRVATVQNEYSLLCRLYDTDMAEMAVNENVTLLSFSPLGAGFLTGKYQNGAVPPGSRMSLGPEMGGRTTPRVRGVVDVYLKIAAAYGLDPVHMAMAWQRTRPFAICPIFGATTVGQLEHILAGYDLRLSPELVVELNAAHKANPMPY